MIVYTVVKLHDTVTTQNKFFAMGHMSFRMEDWIMEYPSVAAMLEIEGDTVCL